MIFIGKRVRDSIHVFLAEPPMAKRIICAKPRGSGFAKANARLLPPALLRSFLGNLDQGCLAIHSIRPTEQDFISGDIESFYITTSDQHI